jgi:hypothetical protein
MLLHEERAGPCLQDASRDCQESGRGHRLQGWIPPLECSVRFDELPVCVRVRMRVGVFGYRVRVRVRRA